MGRKILFVTTDQQRYDALGCNGGTVARTPVADALAAEGVRFERAIPQSVVCMPSRSTMLTGQHVATHGVLDERCPVARRRPVHRRRVVAGRLPDRLIGKPHFEPFIDPFGRFTENSLARTGTFTEYRPGVDGGHPSRNVGSSTWSSPRTARSVRCTTPSG